MKIALGLFVGAIMAMEGVHAARGQHTRAGEEEAVVRRAKGKSGGGGVEKFQGLYKGLDAEDSSQQTLQIICTEGAIPCMFTLLDTSFGRCGGKPGSAIGYSDDPELVTLSVFCEGTEATEDPDGGIIDLSFVGLDLKKKITDGEVLERIDNGFIYWPVQK